MKNHNTIKKTITITITALLLLSSCATTNPAPAAPATTNPATAPTPPANQTEPTTTPAPPPGAPGEPPAADAQPAPKTAIDYIGREITIPDRVDTLACLYAYIGQVVVLLDGGEKLRAVVAGNQRDELLLRRVPGIADMPVPYNSGSINIETLLNVNPDVTLIRYATASSPGELEKLERAGLTYAVVDFYNIEQQKNSVRLVGDILGKEERAEKYITYYENTLDLIKNRTAAIPDEEKLSVYHSVNEVVRTNHANEISYYILDIIGCINVAEGFGNMEIGGSLNVNVEQIYLWDPDVVIANEPAAVAYFKTNEAFSGLRAVREGKVYQLPVGASRWGHPGSIETPIAALYIAKLLYPAYFEDIDIRKEITSFYQEFWEIDLDEEELDSIISGIGMREPKDGRQ